MKVGTRFCHRVTAWVDDGGRRWWRATMTLRFVATMTLRFVATMTLRCVCVMEAHYRYDDALRWWRFWVMEVELMMGADGGWSDDGRWWRLKWWWALMEGECWFRWALMEGKCWFREFWFREWVRVEWRVRKLVRRVEVSIVSESGVEWIFCLNEYFIFNKK